MQTPVTDSNSEGAETQNTEEHLQTLQQEVARVLQESLAHRVISHSPHQVTGNAYQTIRLGGSVLGGFRTERPNLLAGFDVRDRRVCDLGANLGEIARDLRRAGASHVDAYEYDHFFTQLARYITAYEGISDLNHFQADVSHHGFLRGKYEVCVGLSAYSFMQQNINYICEQVSEMMIIETHEVRDEGWHPSYVGRIGPHFSRWCCFGRVQHGAKASDKHRLWLAFASTELDGFYERRAQSLLPDGEGVVDIDLSRSKLGFLDRAGLATEEPGEALSEARLRLYSEKLEQYERQYAAGEPVGLSMSGEVYWLALLCGISEFNRDGGVEEHHVYPRWFKRGVEAGVIDPGLRPLLDQPERLHNRLSLRLGALRRALLERDVSHFQDMPIIYNATPFNPGLESLYFKRLVVRGSGEELCVPRLDGHHRLFVMKLLDIDTCPMMTIWDPQLLGEPKSLARVTNYEQRMYQYLAGVAVEDPIVTSPQSV